MGYVPKKATIGNLTSSVAITGRAYETLTRASKMSGKTLGELTSIAIERAYDPTQNIELAHALEKSTQVVKEALKL